MCETPARCTTSAWTRKCVPPQRKLWTYYELSEVVSLTRLRSRTNENYLLTTHRRSLRTAEFSSLAFAGVARLRTSAAPLLGRARLSGDRPYLVTGDENLGGARWSILDLVPICRWRATQSHGSVPLDGGARALAVYHRIARGFDHSDEQRAGTRNIGHWFRTTVGTSVCLRPAVQPEIEEARTYLVESLDSLSQALASPDIAHLSKLVIHGDFSRRNVLFQQDQLLAVLDFDGCHFEIPRNGSGDCA